MRLLLGRECSVCARHFQYEYVGSPEPEWQSFQESLLSLDGVLSHHGHGSRKGMPLVHDYTNWELRAPAAQGMVAPLTATHHMRVMLRQVLER